MKWKKQSCEFVFLGKCTNLNCFVGCERDFDEHVECVVGGPEGGADRAAKPAAGIQSSQPPRAEKSHRDLHPHVPRPSRQGNQYECNIKQDSRWPKCNCVLVPDNGLRLSRLKSLHCNGLFTLPDSDSDSGLDSDSKTNGYIALCRSFHIELSHIQVQILTPNYRKGIGIKVRTRVCLCQCK